MGAIKNAVTGAWRAWRKANTSGRGCQPSSIVTKTTGSLVEMRSTRGATTGAGGSVVVVGTIVVAAGLGGVRGRVERDRVATRPVCAWLPLVVHQVAPATATTTHSATAETVATARRWRALRRRRSRRDTVAGFPPSTLVLLLRPARETRWSTRQGSLGQGQAPRGVGSDKR